MARIYADRVGETSTAPGTGDFTLNGAIVGYQAFASVAAVGDTFDYAAYAADSSGVPNGGWETGTGTFATSDKISRSAQESSNGNALVNFGTGVNVVVVLSENAESIVALASGGSLPPGGTVHQVLTKLSSTDGDADWQTPSGGGGGAIPVVVQSAHARNATCTLPSALTPGNIVLTILYGARNCNDIDGNSGSGRYLFYTNDQSGGGPRYSKTWAHVRVIESGDTTSFTAGGDESTVSMYEISGAGGSSGYNGNLTCDGSGNWTIQETPPVSGPGLRFGFGYGQDNSAVLTGGQAGVTSQYTDFGSSGSIHGVLYLVDPTAMIKVHGTAAGQINYAGFGSVDISG